ncbi:MAG TPA: hypothetical protein VGN36_04720, partial [Sphingorhabdus sp.]|nr:hypothetical protein [Sphingorhabdus sp.]
MSQLFSVHASDIPQQTATTDDVLYIAGIKIGRHSPFAERVVEYLSRVSRTRCLTVGQISEFENVRDWIEALLKVGYNVITAKNKETKLTFRIANLGQDKRSQLAAVPRATSRPTLRPSNR